MRMPIVQPSHSCTSYTPSGVHRRTSCSPPPDSGKTIIFQAKAKFLGKSQQPKMKKNFLYLLNEKKWN